MKIAFNRKPIDGPYGGGNHILNQLTTWLMKNGHEVCYSPEEGVDWVVLMEARDEGCTFPLYLAERMKYQGTKILHRINENDAHRLRSLGLDALIARANQIADETVFVSRFLQEYFQNRGLVPSSSHVIWNGANDDVFYPSPHIRSVQEPFRIITHHWSDNLLKGYPVYQHIEHLCMENPKLATFVFMGREETYKKYFRHCEFIPAAPYLEVAEHLRGCNLYVTAAQHEPGGNHVAEALLSGLLTYVGVDTGSCIEYAEGYGVVFDNIEDFWGKITALKDDSEQYEQSMARARKFTYSAEQMCSDYLSIITT